MGASADSSEDFGGFGFGLLSGATQGDIAG